MLEKCKQKVFHLKYLKIEIRFYNWLLLVVNTGNKGTKFLPALKTF